VDLLDETQQSVNCPSHLPSPTGPTRAEPKIQLWREVCVFTSSALGKGSHFSKD